MKKEDKEKKCNRIKIEGNFCLVKNVEMSDIEKQRTKKVRIEARADDNKIVVIIRPEDYPIEME